MVKSKVVKRVGELYPNIKRWTKRVDIFSLSYLAIPINSYKHWNCLIVVNPKALLTNPKECKIIFLDSMFEKRDHLFPVAIRRFLELELQERKQISLSLQDIKVYQLLIPRQTNNHDCGLYTLVYLQRLLKNSEILDRDFEVIANRDQLNLFPRSIIFCMRELLRQLFKNLVTRADNIEAIQNYKEEIWKIERESKEEDYDKIDNEEFSKFFQFHSHLLDNKSKSRAEIEYECKIKFYLDADVNYFKKDIFM